MKESFYGVKTPEEALEIYFRNDAELYGIMKNEIIRKILLSRINSWESLKVLEIGAGGGIWTKFFIRQGAEVICIDICEQILKGNAKLHSQAKFIVADATTVKLKEEFQIIFAKDVIEHIKDDEKFLQNMNYHLRDNGLIMINTQNCLSLNYLVQGSYHLLKGNKNWFGWDPTHVRFYNILSLTRKLNRTGFKPVNWFGSYYFPYRIFADHFGKRWESNIFCLIELTGLSSQFLFNIVGWNIGVVCEKIRSI